jgi:hypothetical protein
MNRKLLDFSELIPANRTNVDSRSEAMRRVKTRATKSTRTVTLMKRLADVGEIPPINEQFFYRLHLLPFFLGLEASQIREAIRDGQLPPPVSPTDSGRALGYYGKTILDLQAERRAKAKVKGKAA